MKKLIIFFLYISVYIPINGQEACSLTKAPNVRGLSLGMSLNDLYELIPPARNDNVINNILIYAKRERIPKKVSIQLSKSNSLYQELPIFKDIEYISIQMFNDSLTDISIQYNWPTWTKADEFIDKLKEYYGLPEAQHWQGRDESKHLNCKGFLLSVYAPFNGGALVTMRDLLVEKKMADIEKRLLRNLAKNLSLNR
jgi:hypothetical protein